MVEKICVNYRVEVYRWPQNRDTYILGPPVHLYCNYNDILILKEEHKLVNDKLKPEMLIVDFRIMLGKILRVKRSLKNYVLLRKNLNLLLTFQKLLIHSLYIEKLIIPLKTIVQ